MPQIRPPMRALRLAAMYALRYTPVSWRLKQRLIWLVTPRVVAAGVAVIPDAAGRILVLRARYSGFWMLPGGALKPAEDPLVGTLRECREELGLAVAIERLTAVYARGPNGEVLFAFRAAPVAASPTLSDEHDAWAYHRPEELRPFVATIVRDALTDDAGVRIASLRL